MKGGPRYRTPEILGTPSLDPYLEIHGQLFSGVIIKAIIVMTHIEGLITLLITTHEPPSKPNHPYGSPKKPRYPTVPL